MKTISAKALRDNLDEIVRRARQGESIRVTYRSKAAFMIQPDKSLDTSPRPGSKAAMRDYIKQVHAINKIPRKSELDPGKPIKKLYHDMIDNDPKYKSNYAR